MGTCSIGGGDRRWFHCDESSEHWHPLSVYVVHLCTHCIPHQSAKLGRSPPVSFNTTSTSYQSLQTVMAPPLHHIMQILVLTPAPTDARMRTLVPMFASSWALCVPSLCHPTAYGSTLCVVLFECLQVWGFCGRLPSCMTCVVVLTQNWAEKRKRAQISVLPCRQTSAFTTPDPGVRATSESSMPS